jgi:hypothetical protein
MFIAAQVPNFQLNTHEEHVTTLRNANEVARDLIGLAADCGANCR